MKDRCVDFVVEELRVRWGVGSEFEGDGEDELVPKVCELCLDGVDVGERGRVEVGGGGSGGGW